MKVFVGLAAALFALILAAPAWGGQAPAGGHRPMPMVPAEQVELHARMTEQMRTMASDGRMAADPTWSRMRHDAHIRAEEHHQAGIDRMLGRGSR